MIRCTVGVLAHNEAHNMCARCTRCSRSSCSRSSSPRSSSSPAAARTRPSSSPRASPAAYPIVTVERRRRSARGKAAAIRRLMSMAAGDVIVARRRRHASRADGDRASCPALRRPDRRHDRRAHHSAEHADDVAGIHGADVVARPPSARAAKTEAGRAGRVSQRDRQFPRATRPPTSRRSKR